LSAGFHAIDHQGTAGAATTNSGISTSTSSSSSSSSSGSSSSSSSGSSGSSSSGSDDNQELSGRLKDLFVSQRVYLFSLEKGYLMLRPDQRDRHAIRRLDITVSSDSKCFGPPTTAWLLHNFIGYDTVVMNWAIAIFGGQGYLYNIYSKDLFNLNFATGTWSDGVAG
jgi:hypothetical protein